MKLEICTVAGNGRGYVVRTQGDNRFVTVGLLKVELALTEKEHEAFVARFRPSARGVSIVAGLRVAYLGFSGESHIRVLASAEEAYQLFQRDNLDHVIVMIEHVIGNALL